MQVGFEKAGWQFITNIPRFDRELVSPGQVKRVYEAIYVKVLVTESEFLCPIRDGMTSPTTICSRSCIQVSPMSAQRPNMAFKRDAPKEARPSTLR